jgi:hypothetical protein
MLNYSCKVSSPISSPSNVLNRAQIMKVDDRDNRDDVLHCISDEQFLDSKNKSRSFCVRHRK